MPKDLKRGPVHGHFAGTMTDAAGYHTGLKVETGEIEVPDWGQMALVVMTEE